MANLESLFDALPSPALADRAKSGLEKQKTAAQCGDNGLAELYRQRRIACRHGLYTAASYSTQPPAPILVPAQSIDRSPGMERSAYTEFVGSVKGRSGEAHSLGSLICLGSRNNPQMADSDVGTALGRKPNQISTRGILCSLSH